MVASENFVRKNDEMKYPETASYEGVHLTLSSMSEASYIMGSGREFIICEYLLHG